MTFTTSEMLVECNLEVVVPGREDIQLKLDAPFKVQQGTPVVLTENGGYFPDGAMLLAAVHGFDDLGSFRFTGYPVKAPPGTAFSAASQNS